MTTEEMINELKAQGYIVKEQNYKFQKQRLLLHEAEKLDMPNLWVCKEILDAFYTAADYVTDNYTKKKTKRDWYANCRNPYVRADKEEEYKVILSGFLQVMKPYYNKILGFRDKGVPINELR